MVYNCIIYFFFNLNEYSTNSNIIISNLKLNQAVGTTALQDLNTNRITWTLTFAPSSAPESASETLSFNGTFLQ